MITASEMRSHNGDLDLHSGSNALYESLRSSAGSGTPYLQAAEQYRRVFEDEAWARWVQKTWGVRIVRLPEKLMGCRATPYLVYGWAVPPALTVNPCMFVPSLPRKLSGEPEVESATCKPTYSYFVRIWRASDSYANIARTITDYNALGSVDTAISVRVMLAEMVIYELRKLGYSAKVVKSPFCDEDGCLATARMYQWPGDPCLSDVVVQVNWSAADNSEADDKSSERGLSPRQWIRDYTHAPPKTAEEANHLLSCLASEVRNLESACNAGPLIEWLDTARKFLFPIYMGQRLLPGFDSTDKLNSHPLLLPVIQQLAHLACPGATLGTLRYQDAIQWVEEMAARFTREKPQQKK